MSGQRGKVLGAGDYRFNRLVVFQAKEATSAQLDVARRQAGNEFVERSYLLLREAGLRSEGVQNRLRRVSCKMLDEPEVRLPRGTYRTPGGLGDSLYIYVVRWVGHVKPFGSEEVTPKGVII